MKSMNRHLIKMSRENDANIERLVKVNEINVELKELIPFEVLR